jgi:hypothetical protein
MYRLRSTKVIEEEGEMIQAEKWLAGLKWLQDLYPGEISLYDLIHTGERTRSHFGDYMRAS